MEAIKFFMWGFQRHFQNSAQHAAERLYEALDPGFEVEIFLLGLVRPGSPDDLQPVCLEPEECGFVPDDFIMVREDAREYRGFDSDHYMIMGGHDNHTSSIRKRMDDRAEKKAVLKAMTDQPGSRGGQILFSGFMPVGNYDVGVVFLLKHRYGISHYRLPRLHSDEDLHVPASLAESAADVFLRACRKSLHVPNPETVVDWGGPGTDEMLRKAGDRLMEAPVFAGGGVDGLYGLFDACNYIASLTYERAASHGVILIARDGHPNVHRTLTLAKPVPLKEHRAVRKLLEISSTEDAVLTDGSSVTGFGRRCGKYDEAQADLLEVSFAGHHKWELLHAGHKLMRVFLGQPALPLPPLNRHRFAADVERIFKGISEEAIENLFALANEACRQRHGALLVITPEAAAEVKRLASQATGTVPVPTTTKLLESVTAIDGAVLLDTKGLCHAIGVILDGEAVDHGNPARGARYNSSLRYVARMTAHGKQCLVVVVSEDGTAEWIPELPPRLSRRELEAREEEAEAILTQLGLPISRIGRLLKWLSQHRFYLPPPLCDKANCLAERFHKGLADKGAEFILYDPFVPNPQMSDDYLER